MITSPPPRASVGNRVSESPAGSTPGYCPPVLALRVAAGIAQMLASLMIGDALMPLVTVVVRSLPRPPWVSSRSTPPMTTGPEGNLRSDECEQADEPLG